MPSASAVLYDRYAKSTTPFSVLATLLLSLVAWLVAMFTPSVLAELKLIVDAKGDAQQRSLDRKAALKARHATPENDRNRAQVHVERASAALARSAERARALGRWLTQGYRELDGVVAAVTALGALLGLVIAVAFLATMFGDPQLDAGARISDASQFLLKGLVFSAASLGAALSVLGGKLSRSLPALRSPLDVAMDVDNHFREFPRTNIPRARIFSRYAALLRHVQAQGYDRIVVVSHSQGTVISSEMLRFLSSREQQAPVDGATPWVDGKPLPPVSLLTLGCPLRQLYGARFPGLYAWVLARHAQVFGPRAADLGVQRWMNAFCSGDYVGRWLWSSAGNAHTLAHPMMDGVSHDPFGRTDAYAGFGQAFPPDAKLLAAREVEVCLGLGAHTHYFERDQTLVAQMIDWLVRADPPPDASSGGSGGGPVPTVDAPDAGHARVVPEEASVVSDGAAAPAAAPDAPPPPAPKD